MPFLILHTGKKSLSECMIVIRCASDHLEPDQYVFDSTIQGAKKQVKKEISNSAVASNLSI